MRDQKLMDLAGELLKVLEEDLGHVSRSIEDLDRLRSLLVKHDLAGMKWMLEDIRARTDRYVVVELRRASLRERIARHLGCSAEDVTLYRLAQLLGEPFKGRALGLRAQLRAKTKQLAGEHRATATLLADCTRFNRALLQAIFQDSGQAATAYPSPATRVGSCDSHLVNVRF